MMSIAPSPHQHLMTPIQHLATDGDHQIEWTEYPPMPGAPPALPLLLVHGFTHTQACFAAHWAPYAAAAGIPTYTINLSGRGASTARKPVRQLLPEDFVQDIRLVVEAAHLGEKVVVLGHSLGGVHVQLYASQYPVAGAILASTLARPEDWREGSRAATKAMFLGQPFLFPLFPVWPHRVSRHPKIAKTFFLGPEATAEELALYQAQLCSDSRKALFAAATIPLQPLLTEQVLFLAARHDRIVPLSLVHHSAECREAPVITVDAPHDLMLMHWQEPIRQVVATLRRWSYGLLGAEGAPIGLHAPGQVPS